MSDRYRLLVENLPDAYAYHQIIKDRDGATLDYVFLDVNVVFAEMTGLPRHRVIGKKVTEVLLEVKEPPFNWIGTYGKLALTGEAVSFEEYSEPLNRWYEVTAYSDEPGYFAVFFHDITQHKYEGDQRLLTVLDNIEAITYVADMETYEILFINQHVKKIFGDIMGRKCWQAIQAEQKGPCEFCTNDRLLDAGGEPTGVFQWEFKNTINGRWYDCRDLALSWIDGRMVRLEVATDITALKQLQEQLKKEKNRAEDALHATEEVYRFLLNNVSEAIIVAQGGLYKYVNPMALKLFACAEDELTTKPFTEFIHPDDQDMVLNRYRKRLKGEDVTGRYSYRIKPADGSIKWVGVSSVAIEWEGQPAALALLTDITERKIMDEEIFKADKLESIGILAGGIAHDFNNYLATLLGNTSLAKLYRDNPQKILEKLENIEQATMRAKDLSNQLFTFAKGAAPVKKTVSINDSMVESIKFTLSGSNVRCNFFIANDLHLVEIDEGQFNQVLNNIVINAVQAMPGGGVIWVKAENLTIKENNKASFFPLPEGSFVKISIKDEGIGIPEKYLQKIFDPYFTTKQKGSGFGLATSYSIMRSHGGLLSVKSKIGLGATFYLYLPAATQAGTAATVKGNYYYGSGKILVMDDQEDFLKVTGETLSAFGYDISLAKDGKEAVGIYMDALKQGLAFDLVIMDLTVPGGMGGKDTLKELLKKDPQVKAIVASGYSDDPVMANFRDYGFKGVIKKPFAIEELSKLVYETINC